MIAVTPQHLTPARYAGRPCIDRNQVTPSKIKYQYGLVAGTEDVLVVPKNALYLKDKIAGAQLGLMEAGGHGVMFQYPDRFSKIVTDFLE